MKKSFKNAVCGVCAILMCFVFVLSGCFFSNSNDDAGKEEQTQTQKDFNATMEKLDELEMLSIDYNAENAKSRVLVYIRSERYNSSEWELIGGAIDEEFDAFVEQNQTKNSSSLKSLQDFTIPKTNEQSDFVHMFACMNVVFVSDAVYAQDLSGWGGDLCQLASQAKASGLAGEQLFEYISQMFNSNSGGFNAKDVCADLDACNLATLLKSENKTISQVLQDYFASITFASRKTDFILNAFGKSFDNFTDLKQTILTRVNNNNLLKFWGMQNGLSFTEDAQIIEKCVDIFTNFLLN